MNPELTEDELNEIILEDIVPVILFLFDENEEEFLKTSHEDMLKVESKILSLLHKIKTNFIFKIFFYVISYFQIKRWHRTYGKPCHRTKTKIE